MAEQRFALEFREDATDDPGLVLEDDGSISVVAPGGTRRSLSDGGSGSSGPSIVLAVSAPVDIHAAGGHQFLWDSAFDDTVNFNTAALPEGIGFTNPLDGSDPLLTFTEAGYWYFGLFFQGADDASLHVQLAPNFGLADDFFGPGIAGNSGTFDFTQRFSSRIPDGFAVQFQASTLAPAAANPYDASNIFLEVIRLG